jgi:hypothetical protein
VVVVEHALDDPADALGAGERSFSPVRARSTVPRRRPAGPRAIRTMKVTTALDCLRFTRASVARHRDRGVIAL